MACFVSLFDVSDSFVNISQPKHLETSELLTFEYVRPYSM